MIWVGNLHKSHDFFRLLETQRARENSSIVGCLPFSPQDKLINSKSIKNQEREREEKTKRSVFTMFLLLLHSHKAKETSSSLILLNLLANRETKNDDDDERSNVESSRELKKMR